MPKKRFSPLDPQVQKLGYKDYDDYLQSRHWQEFRRRYRESRFPQVCKECGNENYQLHHLTYANLGHEELTDVSPLCRKCHRNLHLERQGKAVGNEFLQKKLTKKNSTKRERKAQARQRRALRKKNVQVNQPPLVECSSCGRKVRQEGPYCTMCGSLTKKVIKPKRITATRPAFVPELPPPIKPTLIFKKSNSV